MKRGPYGKNKALLAQHESEMVELRRAGRRMFALVS